ncbi:uridine kinase [Aquamicrobium sp. LC103]|uniref:uridine kinase n=1 Tax=Aquamicrobium sp. LC103 TaxID=1120658 RepID=UPI00069B4030|nr:uridine kinase [Aquamicrobium sp. LC103]TKT75418.1 uridine kinase [Aquamicrobium sp. LC103]
MSTRPAVFEALAARIAGIEQSRPIVAIDGVDGSGKTTFADELAPLVEARGRPVVRASVDGFHNPRRIRYARGKGDPLGFFLDSYNYESFKHDLLLPFGGGADRVCTKRFDHKQDREVAGEHAILVSGDAILLIDGIFLHRDELRDLWSLSVFLDVPFAVSYARMAVRDGSDPDPSAAENRRYLEGQKIYLRSCRPRARATILIDNSDLQAPRIVADGGGRSIP